MPIEKHINFFELEKVLVKPGCPLCRIINDRTERYIDNMLFEHITNRSFRAEFRAAGGFCAYHSRNLESFRDGLAVAILSRDILEDRIKSFKTRKKWAPKQLCPACAQRLSIEEDYLNFISACKGNSSEENELKKLFLASDGFCVIHYAQLFFTAKGRPRDVPKWLIDFHENKYNELLQRIDKFTKLSAYGRQDEFNALSTEDKLVWKEAAAALRGNV